MTIWFAILTHNRPESLLALVQSIDRQTLPVGWQKQIVIWDNESALAARDKAMICERLRQPGVRYIYSWKNLFMVAKYQLERVILENSDSDSDFFVHLDDDVQLQDGWLNAAIEAITRENFDVCGSVEPRDGVLMVSGQSELALRDAAIDGSSLRVWDWVWEPVGARDITPVVFAGHRALLTRVACVEKVRHSQDILIGGEDLDYSLELKEAGFRLCFSPSAKILHRAKGETEIPGFRSPQRVIDSWRHFYRKWGFVRMDACEEAGLQPEEWVRMFTTDDKLAP